MVSDDVVFTRTNSITEVQYFDPRFKKTVNFIKEYYDTYRTAPNIDQIKAETGITIEKRELSLDEIEYANNEIETFCRYRAIEHAVLAAPPLLDKEEYGELEKNIKDAIAVGLNKDLGLDYFDDPEYRLKSMLSSNSMISTGWLELDVALNGGLNRKEMTIFGAPPGVGKSMTMMNLSVNFIKQKMNVLYITLELSDNLVAKRFDSMMSGLPQPDIFKNISEVSELVKGQSQKCGKLTIKRMSESTTNSNDIRAFLKEYEMMYGIIPDVICADYLDLMTTNGKISAENLFVKDKYISEELRSIANDYDLIMVSAAQLNRNAINATEYSQNQIAGGISKINTADNVIYVTQTDIQRAAGEYVFIIQKARSSAGQGTKIPMIFDQISLRITDVNKEKTVLNLSKKSKPNKSKNDLMKLMDFDN